VPVYRHRACRAREAGVGVEARDALGADGFHRRGY
jgi:hypothetical protein